MSAHIAAACYREIGAELRKHREAAGLSHVAIAPDFGCSPSKISRIETGHVPISEVDVIHFLGLCGVYIPEARPLMEMCRVAERHMGYWLVDQDDRLEDSIRSLIYHESTARSSVTYEPQMIPGLLQIEDYARAMISREEWRTAGNIEFCVCARMERQRILHRPRPARFTFYVQEHALRTTHGDPVVMHEQLLALTLLDGLPHVNIRVVPDPGTFGGAFRLLEYTGHQPLVYLDAYVGGLFLEDREHIDIYRRLLSTIADVALDERQSREFLATLASDHDRERADLDAHDRVEEKQL